MTAAEARCLVAPRHDWRDRGHILINHNLPRKRPRLGPYRKAQRTDQGIHRVHGMHKRAERVPPQPPERVLYRDPVPLQPMVARIDQAVQAPAALRRKPHQRLHPGIAAHDAIERDDIGREKPWREIDEIAALKADATAEALPGRLLARRIEIRRRDIDAGRLARAGPEQLELNRAHATTDVEHRAPLDAGTHERVDQRPRRRGGTALAIVPEVSGRGLLIELAGPGGRVAASHRRRAARAMSG